MRNKRKICNCPNCGRPIDITDWDGVDPKICMCCCEQFEINEVDNTTIKYARIVL
jgi:hypothetical protein